MTVAEFAGQIAWGRDSVILLTGLDGRLYRVPQRGGQPVVAAELDESRQENAILRPIFLPDGRRFIFQTFSQDASKSAVFLGSLDGPSRTHLLDGLRTVAYADGHLVYERNRTLMVHRFDDRSGRLFGEAVPTIENISVGQRGFSAFSIAQTGTLAYRAETAGAGTLAWFDRQGQLASIVHAEGSYESPALSPDGRWLAVRRMDHGQHDIWVLDLERNLPRRLTSDPAVDDFPVWSADGTHVIFASNRNGPYDLYRRAADGSGDDELLFASPEIKRPTSMSPDGLLLFTVRTRPGSNSLDIW